MFDIMEINLVSVLDVYAIYKNVEKLWLNLNCLKYDRNRRRPRCFRGRLVWTNFKHYLWCMVWSCYFI